MDPLARWSTPGPATTGGKSEHPRAVCRLTPGQGDLEESATESRPPRTRPLVAPEMVSRGASDPKGLVPENDDVGKVERVR